jgi:hypothetical protein
MITQPEADIISNAVRTPDGTFLKSHHRHDYQVHRDKFSGEVYMVDGGCDYLRRSRNVVEAEDLTVWSDDPHEQVRGALTWGTRGPLGDQPVTWVRLCDMDTDHIQACLDNVPMMKTSFRAAMVRELGWRKVCD